LTQAKPAGVSAKHGNDLGNGILNFSYNLKINGQLCPVWKKKCLKKIKSIYFSMICMWNSG